MHHLLSMISMILSCSNSPGICLIVSVDSLRLFSRFASVLSASFKPLLISVWFVACSTLAVFSWMISRMLLPVPPLALLFDVDAMFSLLFFWLVRRVEKRLMMVLY